MDFVSKTYGQISDLIKSMTPAARFTTALLLVGVVASLLFLFSSNSKKSSYPLYGGVEVSQEDLSQMAQLFGSAGLNEFEIRGSQMFVPRGKRAAYLRALDGTTFHSFMPHTGQMEPFEKRSPFTTTKSEQRKLAAHKAGLLARRIETMVAIQKAFVEVDRLETGRLNRKQQWSAVATVEGLGGRSIDSQIAQTIRATISSAYAGLSKQDVTVVDTTGQVFDEKMNGTTMNLRDDKYAMRKDYYEQLFRQKILNQLSDIPKVKVAVNVDLNPVDKRSMEVALDSTKSVALSAEEQTDTSSSTRPSVQGRPGLASNGLQQHNQPLTAGTGNAAEETRERSKSKTTTEPSRTVTQLSEQGFIPNRGIASIRVPRSYVVKVWQTSDSANADKEPSEADLVDIWSTIKNEVVNSVASLLPPTPPGTDPYPQVVVSRYQDGLNEITVPTAGLASKATGWLGDNWQTLGLAFVGLFSLIMLRGMVKTDDTPDDNTADSESPPESDSNDRDIEEEAAAASRLHNNPGGPDIRQELSELVQADPDGALAKLRTWLTEVG